METAWGCSALEAEEPSLERLHQAGTTVTLAERPPGKPPGTGGLSLLRLGPKARSDRERPQRSGPLILGSSSAPIRGTLDLELAYAYPLPRLLGAVW